MRAMKRSSKYMYLPMLFATLMGCGGTGQDDGTVSTVQDNYRGLALDGYLARATVFLDTNNNGTRDAWEPFAFTDNDGYYSFNEITNTDYCAEGASASEAIYCLTTNIEYDEVVIRIDGGYDTATGEPFVGQLSRRVQDTSMRVVSPITSLLTEASSGDEQQTLLNSLGLNETDIDTNYLNTDGAGNIDSNLLNTAIKVHKVVTVFSDRLTDTYDEIGQELGTPNDASSVVYRQLSQQIVSSGQTLDQTLGDNNTLARVLDNSESELRTQYTDLELSTPADLGNTSTSEGFSRVINVASSVSSVVDRLIDPNATMTESDTTGSLRAVESVVIKALNETGVDTSIDNAQNFFTNPDNNTLVNSVLSALSQDNADVISLSRNDFTGDDFDSEEEVSQVAALSDEVSPFTAIGGFQLRLSDLDLGRAPDDLDDVEVEIYFNGEQDDIDGSFDACVKFIDGANADGTLGEGNSRGELITGFWSLLGTTEVQENGSFSLLITLTFLGTTYQAIIKPDTMETIDGIEYERVRSDYDDELAFWHSVNGFEPITTLPTTDAQCEARLPSRVGI